MKRILVLLWLVLSASAYAADDLNSVFPTVGELPGGRANWVHSVAPVEKADECKVYSATYAYFTYQSKPLFDIPRKNVYSVNIRFHECQSIESATTLYEKFAAVGEKERKNLMSVGERGILYVVPSPLSPLMGDYYLSSLFRYVVMQVHADDGFVLMDVAEMMDKRLAAYLRKGKGDVTGGLTVQLGGEGFAGTTEIIPFTDRDAAKIAFSGVVYDQNNLRVPGVELTVLETGAKGITDEKGEFLINLDVGEGKEIELFRTLSLERLSAEQLVLPDGFYKVDINYKTSGETGQDYWKLSTDPDGKVSGRSYKISDGTMLSFSGNVGENSSVNIDRGCGSSVLGICMQRFAGEKKDGVIEGQWSGSGGGGSWRLYLDSFSIRGSTPSLKEAGLEVSGNKISKDSFITIKPSGSRTDFLLDSVWLNVESISEEEIQTLYLYGIDGDKRVFVASASAKNAGDNRTNASFDISSIYENPMYSEYQVGLAEDDNRTAQAKLTLGLWQAAPQAKSNSAGLLSAKLINFETEDVVANVKPIRPDGKKDIAIELRIKIYGQSLNGLDIASSGSGGKRQWSTHQDNFYPGIAVKEAGALVNPETALSHQLNKFENVLTLYIDKGSLTEDEISGFTITVDLDGEKIAIPVTI